MRSINLFRSIIFFLALFGVSSMASAKCWSIRKVKICIDLAVTVTVTASTGTPKSITVAEQNKLNALFDKSSATFSEDGNFLLVKMPKGLKGYGIEIKSDALSEKGYSHRNNLKANILKGKYLPEKDGITLKIPVKYI